MKTALMLKPLIMISLYLFSVKAFALCPSTETTTDFPDSQVTSDEKIGIQIAWYDDATDRYAHGVLGDAIEASVLTLKTTEPCEVSITLDTEHVFEDIAPRLANIDNIPGAEVITVRSHQDKGAQVAIYKLTENNTIQLLATTPYIGTRNRWLAPVGVADFDNDGNIDIAFVDRPHLAKILSVWSYQNDQLQLVTSQGGFSNHRIGENFISGGVRQCNARTEMITADAAWQNILATTLVNGQLISEEIGQFVNAESFSAALQCP